MGDGKEGGGGGGCECRRECHELTSDLERCNSLDSIGRAFFGKIILFRSDTVRMSLDEDDTRRSTIEPAAEGAKMYVDRGFERIQEGSFDKALGYFDDALKLDPKNARAFYGRGATWHSLDEIERAICDYDAAIRLDPSLSRAFLNRGVLRDRLGEEDEALCDFAEAIRLDPQDAYAYLYRGSAWYERQEFARAVSDYGDAIRLQPTNANAYLQRGRAWKELGELENALQDIHQAVHLDPKLSEGYKNLSLLWQEKGEFDKAQDDFAKAAQLEGAAAQNKAMIKRKTLIAPLIQEHFHPEPLENLAITERKFPFRVRADLQRAIDRLFSEKTVVSHFCGVMKHNTHEGMEFSTLIVPSTHDPAISVPPQYEELDIGEEDLVRCLKTGLWLLQEDGNKFVVFLSPSTRHGMVTGLQFQVAVVNNAEGNRITQRFFKHLEDSVLRSESYRGKILSFEVKDRYSGASTGILVHRLRTVKREEVILPRKTLDLLERNVVEFARQRRKLAALGLSTKKGILFYGPPGTGKTHTIHYLAEALKGHTTFLITAEQVGLLGEYMTLARLLQPAIVVIEDVDLIARDRATMGNACEEALLNKLLNEMDGLKPETDVLFILTTNRPEALESALASRPGRVDQAIEFPLPDEEGRLKLVRLYSRGLSVPEDVVLATARKTEKVSASFIKELMRRAAQFHFEREDAQGEISIEDVDAALLELLFTGGSLNRKLLGAETHASDE
jgi:cell division protease FtsH